MSFLLTYYNNSNNNNGVIDVKNQFFFLKRKIFITGVGNMLIVCYTVVYFCNLAWHAVLPKMNIILLHSCCSCSYYVTGTFVVIQILCLH